ncbi:unnamed protein product [Lathyrus sativus]|nr:unnamed protein product [Lathyrus sativus]
MRMLKPLALFILILCTIQPNNAEDIIEESCHRAPKYFLECVKYVKPYQPSPKNPIEVVITMFNIMRDKADTTSTKISQVLAGKARPGTREYEALEQCDNSYKDIETSDYQKARYSIARGNPKFSLDTANDVLRKVSKCEVTFYGRAGGDIRTPLTDENNEMTLVVTIAAQILGSLL